MQSQLPLHDITNIIQQSNSINMITDPLILKSIGSMSSRNYDQRVYNFSLLKQIAFINWQQINFGECIPNQIYERSLTLTLKQDLMKPIAFTMQINCSDQILNQLPQFVFAIKKGKQFQFTDLYKFRLHKKGIYEFIIAVKTPNFSKNYKANAQLKIYSEFSNLEDCSDYFSVHLSQQIVIPTIDCLKQLVLTNQSHYQLHKDNYPNNQRCRILKFCQTSNKIKKQIRVPFRFDNNIKVNLTCELVGLENNFLQRNLLQLKVKEISLAAKGQFVIIFKFNFPNDLLNHLQNLQKQSNTPVFYSIRRIFVMRIHQTNLFYHFPIEASYYLGNKNNNSGTD